MLRKLHRLNSGLLVAASLLPFLIAMGCTAAEVQSHGTSYVPISLAIGTFDPVSDGPIPLPAELTLKSYPKGKTGYYIVQFKGPVLEKWKKALISAGARLLEYIPRFAFIVKMDDRSREFAENMEAIRWIGIYQPGYRIAPDLLAPVSKKSGQSVDLFVSVFPGEDVSKLASEIGRLGGEIGEISERYGKIRVKIPPKSIPALSRLNGIKWIEKAPELKIFPSIKRRTKDEKKKQGLNPY